MSTESGADERLEDSALTGVDDSFGFSADGQRSASEELPAGANLGGVTIVRLLGAGGMGRVYEARQEAPRRTVAVKLIRGGVVSAAAAARFVREAETLALLRHPHIAQIHTCGTAPAAYGGGPFFVMELIENARSLTRFAVAHALSIRERVSLFRKVCDAVAHGHRHGVVHRDLKPANILVDDRGEPKVIDYGISRESRGSATELPPAGEQPTARAVTESGDVVGTLRYISPEQVLTPSAAPDARSDVYALGAVLHELVTGRLPHDLQGKTMPEVMKILGSNAAPATCIVEGVAAAEERRDDARALAVIVAKCLEPAMADRYENAGELEKDVGRWLEGRTIMARPPTPMESLRRLMRRHRLACLSAAALMLTLVVAVVAVSLLSVRADGQRRAAEAAGRVAAAEAAAARRQLYASTVLLAAAARDRDNLDEAERLLDEARSLAESHATAQPLELSCLAASLDEATLVLRQSAERITAVAWSPDGRCVASGDGGGTVRLQGSGHACGDPPRVLGTYGGTVWSVVFSPDGRRLAAAADGVVMIHEVVSGRRIRELAVGRGPVYAVAFSPDGQRVVTASRDRTARVIDIETGREETVLRGHEGTVYSVVFSPDGARLATASHDGVVRVWDAASGRLECTFRGHADRVFDVAMSADGKILASASEDRTVRLWSIDTEEELNCLRHASRVNAVAFSADGSRIATAAGDGVLRVWDVTRGVEAAHLRGHKSGLWSVAWAHGDDRIAAATGDGAVRVWDLRRRPDVVDVNARVLSAAYSPDGRTLALATDDAEVRLRDAATLEDRGNLGPAVGRVHGVAWAPDGALIAGACDDGVLFMWDAASREKVVSIQAHTKRIYAVAFAPDGRSLASASEDRSVRIIDPRNGDESPRVLLHPRRVFCAAFAPGGTRVATACEDRIARLFDAASGEECSRLTGHEGPVNWVAFSPDGSRVATASSDGTVRVWRSVDGTLEHVLAGPASQVWKAGFSPDGSRVAAAAADGTVHVWDVISGRPALSLVGHRDQVWAIAFAPDGNSIVSGSWDGTARLWGVAPADIVRRGTGAIR